VGGQKGDDELAGLNLCAGPRATARPPTAPFVRARSCKHPSTSPST
jgi:hypothetical protein